MASTETEPDTAAKAQQQRPPAARVTKPAVNKQANTSIQRTKRNGQIHQLYVRQEYTDCLKLIEIQLKECRGQCEYPIYVKALIRRQQGCIQESLQLFQAATCLNPHNISNLKQVGRSLYLLGKWKSAIEVYDEAQRIGIDDWEVWHNKGLCHLYLKKYSHAIECFKQANSIQRHDSTYMQLGKVHTLQENYKAAIEIYLEALEFSPENPEILTTVGLLYLRLGDNYRAFDFLGNSLTHDPKNPKSILAAGSIIQDHNDMDVALVKYRIAAVATPNSAQLWNNIGMCFFGKGRNVAAIACLKRALYLDPFEWIISYNLGLVHLNQEQYASAFHYLSASINLKPGFASSYMYLGIILSRLDDFENACHAYEKAIGMESDHLFELNYAITLFTNGVTDRAATHYEAFKVLWNELDDEVKNADPDVIDQMNELQRCLKQA
mmetsp:Transcript_10287/g.19430  ORF Transcript_10287/g.19430 Transcript_10287/m.19430 type:complete len:437 (+) Transcript_10287:32-1342(+)|eukprot:CAMPEP_0175137338 /NCGR_PEP_ID=MMETSP0087-20121206/9760_1 /TAXON_ID=136419 /ORGANISM="Unknown Unknown, Strain D1" /LENGTH=436 /DNA_ID=CAMNT_0016420163 /DNA_START=29 /DNA_END=1339 /DNA_ORIENTATION=+